MKPIALSRDQRQIAAAMTDETQLAVQTASDLNASLSTLLMLVRDNGLDVAVGAQVAEAATAAQAAFVATMKARNAMCVLMAVARPILDTDTAPAGDVEPAGAVPAESPA